MSDEPPPLAAGDLLFRAALSRRESLLGPDGGYRWVKAATVAFGRPVVYRNGIGSFPPSFRSRPDVDRWHYATVVFPFDLEHPAPQWLDVTVRVWLDEPDAVALNLQPNGVVDAAGAVPREGVTPDLAEFDGGWPRRPRPLVNFVVAGLGRPTFSWRLAQADGGPLVDGGHAVRVVLQHPLGLRELTGALGASASVRVSELGQDEQVLLQTPEDQPIALPLAQGVAAPAPLTREQVR